MRVRKILIVYTCINRDCRQINCPSIADLFCDYFNPRTNGPVDVYNMFIVVKFLDIVLQTCMLRRSTVDQCSLVRAFPLCWTNSQMGSKIYLLSAPKIC